MNKSSFIGKIICLSFAFVLLVTLSVLNTGRKAVMAGAGSGIDEQINTVQEMSDMIESFSGMFGGVNFSSSEGPETVKRSFADDNVAKQKYQSATMNEISSVHANSSMRVDGNYATASVNYQRDLTYYITDYAFYYVADCVMSVNAMSSISGQTQSTSASISMNMELYYDTSIALIRFNRLSVSTKGVNTTGVEKIIGKWIEFGVEDADVVDDLIGSVNDANINFLKMLDDSIDNYKETGFVKTGNIYTLTDEAFKAFAKRVLSLYQIDVDLGEDGLDLSGSMTVDLTNNKNPKVRFELREKFGSSSSNTTSASEYDVIEFRNINNTVIRLPDNIQTYSVQELEGLFGG